MCTFERFSSILSTQCLIYLWKNLCIGKVNKCVFIMSMKARLGLNWIFLHLTSSSNKSSSSPEMWAELSQRTNHRRCTRGVEKTKPSHRLTNYKIYNEKTEDFGTPAADVGSVSRNANETEIHRPKAHSFQKVWQSYFAHKAEWFRVWVQLSLHNVYVFKDLLKKRANVYERLLQNGLIVVRSSIFGAITCQNCDYTIHSTKKLQHHTYSHRAVIFSAF